MTNALIITPATFKQQLIWRMHTLVEKRPKMSYDFEEPVILDTGIECTNISCISGNDIEVVCFAPMESDMGSFTGQDFYIEQLWDLYMALEPIYQRRIENYGALADA